MKIGPKIPSSATSPSGASAATRGEQSGIQDKDQPTASPLGGPNTVSPGQRIAGGLKPILDQLRAPGEAPVASSAAAPHLLAGADPSLASDATTGDVMLQVREGMRERRRRGDRKTTASPSKPSSPAAQPSSSATQQPAHFLNPKILWGKTQLGIRYQGRPWRDEVLGQINRVTIDGMNVTIAMKNGDIVRDKKNVLSLVRTEAPAPGEEAKKASKISAQAVLEMARSKGWRTLEISGDDEFVRDIVTVALETNYFKACDLVGANDKTKAFIRDLCLHLGQDPDYVPPDFMTADPVLLPGEKPEGSAPFRQAFVDDPIPDLVGKPANGSPALDPREAADRRENEAAMSDLPGMG